VYTLPQRVPETKVVSSYVIWGFQTSQTWIQVAGLCLSGCIQLHEAGPAHTGQKGTIGAICS
jgi:hypothetical protein